MVKKKSERLKIVLDLADRNEKAALNVLTKKRRYRDEQLAQLNNLKHYHVQYLEDIKKPVGQVQNVSNLQANLQFLTQIDQAIMHQEGVFKIAEREFTLALKAWTGMHQKTKGMGDLITTYRNQEIQSAEKKEQLQIESDISARSHNKL